MSEFVSLRTERMLPEYELMKKGKMFSDEELRVIMKKRKLFEARIHRQQRVPKDYCEYICYERNILTTVAQKEGTADSTKMGTCEQIVANHIIMLYKEAVELFPHERRFWEHYVKFCKTTKFPELVTHIYELMLKHHGHEPTAWLRASSWEFEAENYAKAKEILLQALQRHPKDAGLHLKFFKVMLVEASKMSAALIFDNNTKSEQLIGLERVLVIYESSKSKISNIQYLIALLKITEEFPFTKSIQQKLLDDMMVVFPRHELLWHTLAQRELNNFNYIDLSDATAAYPTEDNKMDVDTSGGQPQPTQPKKRTFKRRIELCCEVYKSACEELNTEKMWTLYINAMLELNRDMSTQKVLKREKLAEALDGAYKANCLSETHFFTYIELLNDRYQHEKNAELKKQYEGHLEKVMERSTILYKKTTKFWELYMAHYMNRDYGMDDKVYQIFRRAVRKLAGDSYPLWRAALLYYQTRYDQSDRVEELYYEAAQLKYPNFHSYRGDYIMWYSLTRQIEETRQLYEALTKFGPQCKDLHEKMALLESNQIRKDIDEWRKCHENLVQFFGKDHTDVWVNYMQFERKHGDPKNMAMIVERAKSTLREDLVDDFISTHSLIKSGFMIS